ncbi:Methyl-accepting chemotaxis serine transducer [Pararobbsia alpina]|uniref:methyl-accepting chemotaxis protein n=1 Tax=Pararobbsia alpina TaxID=621374 RepID=UPI0039A485AB
MRSLTVRSTLLAVLVLFAAMILAGGVLGVVALSRANVSTTRLHEVSSQEILANDGYKDTTRTRAALTRAYSALKERNDTATRDSALKSAATSAAKAQAEIESFRKTPPYDGQDTALKQQISDSATHLTAVLTRAADALHAGDTSAYSQINDTEITSAGAAYSASVEKFQHDANDLSADIIAGNARQYTWVVTLVVIGVSVALVLVIGAHFALLRVVARPLKKAAELLDRIAENDLTVVVPEAGGNEIGQLFGAMHRMQSGLTRTVSNVRDSCEAIHGGAREIAAGNLDLSSRTEEQSASLEETAASMEQLTSTVKQNADNALQASNLADETSKLAERGGLVVGQAVQTMAAISSSSKKIADITGMIDSIAFQTNILALNAAVESARAGEQGRGFAVVAGEVRALAQRSAGAAREIKELIGASVDDVRSGNELVVQAGRTMGEIVDAARNVATLMSEITSASVEQSSGIEQVSLAVSQMDQVTQQNAALVEQVAAAANALETQAQAMRTTVSVFRVASV